MNKMIRNLKDFDFDNNPIFEIGKSQWNHKYLKKQLKTFYRVYMDRPIKDNLGGMGPAHMFACWIAIKTLKPEYIIESGVWYGAGTWLIESAAPNAKIICLDPNLKEGRYRGKNAFYSRKDFGLMNWSSLPKDKTLIIFDDHQNALRRVRESSSFGFKHIIFEDNNYPSFQKGGSMGDFYSIKRVFSGRGHNFDHSIKLKLLKMFWAIYYTKSLKSLILTIKEFRKVPKNSNDRKKLFSILKCYYEFPPIFKKDFSDKDIEKWFRQDPLVGKKEERIFPEIANKENQYNGICYLKLK